MASEHRQISAPYGTTAAPPPTPSTQPISNSSATAMDTLSLLLHRLPPSLSLRPSRSPRATTPPVISLSSPSNLLHSASQLGFFQLTDHSIPAQLARSADSEAASLFNLSDDEKTLRFPQNWPLGFENDDDETGALGSFCINLAESSTELDSVRELACEMERVALEVVEALSCTAGFVNPVRVDPAAVCSLVWISQGSTREEPVVSGKLYPYVVGLEYQIRRRKCSLLTDSGWVSVSPQIDSLLVTIGDIAQVKLLFNSVRTKMI
jgi:hypothetical protein